MNQLSEKPVSLLTNFQGFMFGAITLGEAVHAIASTPLPPSCNPTNATDKYIEFTENKLVTAQMLQIRWRE